MLCQGQPWSQGILSQKKQANLNIYNTDIPPLIYYHVLDATCKMVLQEIK